MLLPAMKVKSLRISFFGEASASSNEPESVRYYRRFLEALAHSGHMVTVFEPEVTQSSESVSVISSGEIQVVTYESAFTNGVMAAISAAKGSDVILKAAVVGVHDALLEAALVDLKTEDNLLIFWDADPQETLERLREVPADPFLRVLPSYDLVLLPGCPKKLIELYQDLGARHYLSTAQSGELSGWLEAALHPAPC